MTEGELQDAIRLELNHPDLVLWRNNIGTAVLPNGSRVKYGVGNPGGADLIGLFRGRFVGVEIKVERGRQSRDQLRFQLLVERKGGIYTVIRSVTEARALLEDLDRRFPVVRETGSRYTGESTAQGSSNPCAVYPPQLIRSRSG